MESIGALSIRPFTSVRDAQIALAKRFLLAFLSAPLLPLILVRRLLRCLRQLPSSSCRGGEDARLEPTMSGLHHRFLKLYSSPADAASGTIAAQADSELQVVRMQKRLTLSDGQELAFWDLGPQQSEDVVMLCQGLGARVAGWTPLLDALHEADSTWKKRRLIIPEYRGQFGSMPLQGGLSIGRSAADLSELADLLKVRSATLLCWSTGVQVGLQLAANKPDLVKEMVLIQGTIGQLFTCVLQPFCCVPGLGPTLRFQIGLAQRLMKGALRKSIYDFLQRHTRRCEFLSSLILWFFGSDFMPTIGIRYTMDMLQSDAHFANYCEYAKALDRHEIAERLPEIKAKALIVTGTPDFITPARCSYTMAAMLGGPVELLDDFSASHYYIMEEPQKLARRIAQFLCSART